MNAKQKLHQAMMTKWTALINQQLESGLPIREWCIKNNQSFHAYNYWKHLIKESMVDSVIPDIVPISPGTGIITSSPSTDIIPTPSSDLIHCDEAPMSPIKEKAFYNCHSLTSIVIPGSVKDIGSGAFKYCSVLEDVTIDEGIISDVYDSFIATPWYFNKYECGNGNYLEKIQKGSVKDYTCVLDKSGTLTISGGTGVLSNEDFGFWNKTDLVKTIIITGDVSNFEWDYGRYFFYILSKCKKNNK